VSIPDLEEVEKGKLKFKKPFVPKLFLSYKDVFIHIGAEGLISRYDKNLKEIRRFDQQLDEFDYFYKINKKYVFGFMIKHSMIAIINLDHLNVT
jgi:hypothetical protein